MKQNNYYYINQNEIKQVLVLFTKNEEMDI